MEMETKTERKVKIMRERGTRRLQKKAGPETARTRTVSPMTTVLRESARDGATINFHLCGDTQPRSSSRFLQEIFDIRARLESYAAARAAERASAEQREAVKQSAERMSRHVAALAKRSDPDIARRIEEENAFFHRLILEAACAPRLERLLQSTVDVAFVSLTLQRYSLGQRVRSAGHHHDIAEAIALGMAEWAARTMEAHILAAAASFRNRYGVAAETPQDDKA